MIGNKMDKETIKKVFEGQARMKQGVGVVPPPPPAPPIPEMKKQADTKNPGPPVNVVKDAPVTDQMPDIKKDKKEVWEYDPSNFVTDENIKKVDINDDDVMKIFMGKSLDKKIDINDKLSVVYRTLSKAENDELDKQLMGDDTLMYIEAAKMAEKMSLAKAILSINGEPLGADPKDTMFKLESYSNHLFRILWCWYLVFERSVAKAVTAENVKKS